jgi:hypothetical protein
MITKAETTFRVPFKQGYLQPDKASSAPPDKIDDFNRSLDSLRSRVRDSIASDQSPSDLDPREGFIKLKTQQSTSTVFYLPQNKDQMMEGTLSGLDQLGFSIHLESTEPGQLRRQQMITRGEWIYTDKRFTTSGGSRELLQESVLFDDGGWITAHEHFY